MTKPKVTPDNPEQAKRFAEAVRELTDAGELDPTEANEKFESAFKKMVKPSPKSD